MGLIELKNKYRYYVKIKKPFIFKNNLYFEKVFNLSEDTEFYYFYVMGYKDSVLNLECEIIDLYKGCKINFIKKYLITIIGLILFIFILSLVNNNVTEIKFKNDDLYDEEVYKYVCNKLKGNKYKFISNQQINNINENIRSVFYKYQWLSISKVGTIIYIDATLASDDQIENSNNQVGGLYSKYDAIIKGYFIKKGLSLIKKDVSVNVGDELISGKIPLYDNKVELIHPEGYVIGEVSEYITKEINKFESNIKRSGKFKKYRNFIFFGKTNNKEYKDYDNYDIEYKSIFKIDKIFEIQEVKIYENIEITNEYSLEDSKSYAKSLIIDEFNQNKLYDNEKIVDIKYINGYLNNDMYYVTYLIVSLKNISEFIPY